jgi:hypothetical protein
MKNWRCEQNKAAFCIIKIEIRPRDAGIVAVPAKTQCPLFPRGNLALDLKS